MLVVGDSTYNLYVVRAFPAVLGKGPWPKLGKMIDFSSKLGEIQDIKHNKGEKNIS